MYKEIARLAASGMPNNQLFACLVAIISSALQGEPEVEPHRTSNKQYAHAVQFVEGRSNPQSDAPKDQAILLKAWEHLERLDRKQESIRPISS